MCPRGLRAMNRALALPALAALLCAGCADLSQMSFRQDQRLVITSPSGGETVRLPFTVRWTMRDFTAMQPGSPVKAGTGYYAIFLDRYPMAPGKSFASLVTNNACQGEAGCPNPTFLAENMDIFVTSATSYTINAVPSGGALDSGSHFVTIILVDGAGKRIGDASWTDSFTVTGSGS
jgi:hypothetical protein